MAKLLDTNALNAIKTYVDSNVVANPTLAGTETKLSGVQIGDTKYKVVSPVSMSTVITEGEPTYETEEITGVIGDTSKTKNYAGGNGAGGTPCWWLASVPAFKNACGSPLNSISLYTNTAGVIWLYQANVELDCTNNTTMPTLAAQADSNGTLFLKITISSAEASSGQKLTFLLDGTDSRVEFATGVSTNPICPKTIGLSKATGSKVAFNNSTNAVLDLSGLGIVAGFGQASGAVTANAGYYQCFMLEFNYTKTTETQGETTTELKMTLSDNTEISCELGDIQVELDQDYLEKYPLQGKKISIIGDSISTYSGYLPSGYNSRYPSGVIQNVNQTWWYPLIQDTKMTLLKNCSYNGSTVSGQQNTNHSAGYSTTGSSPYPACGDKRISDLANGTDTPDIVICFIGINDFGANRSVPVGTYDGLSAIPADSSTGMADFTSAYGLMIKKIHAAYPNAIVYCCTLPPTTGSTYNPNGTFPTKNTTTGDCLADFNNAIRTLANNMNCRIMEFAKAGITFWNNSTYMEDGVHPSVLGHKTLKRMAETTLIHDFTLTEQE